MVGRTVIAAILITGATMAQAQADTADPRQGIANSRAAGIQVDPAVEDMMARAPIGSCANDPSRAECPPARAIVYAGDGTEEDGWTSYGDPADLARTSTLFPQCAIKVSDNPNSPYKAAGKAQMNAANQCYATVTRHELYGSLWKYYKSRWYHMNTTSTAGLGATTIRVHTTYRCTATPLRAWRARGEGYALLAGVWYVEAQEKYNNLSCG
jgi:hypothetical protein